jgi:hypothetical protein
MNPLYFFKAISLVTPVPRSAFQTIAPTSDFCSNTQPGAVRFEAVQYGRTLIGWSVQQASDNSNCTLSVSNGSKTRLLKPIRDADVAEDGQFPCGRHTTSFEGREVRMPRDLECSGCVLQLTYDSAQTGRLSICSDMEIVGGLTHECVHPCQNGGVCENGECVCIDQYYGPACEYGTGRATSTHKDALPNVSASSSTAFLVWTILIIAILGILAAAFQRDKMNRSN